MNEVRAVSPREVRTTASVVPGVVYIPGIGPLALEQWVEDVIYDTVTLPTSISAGQTFEFFTNISGKSKWETNMTEAGRLPEGWMMWVVRAGLELLPGTDPDDAFQIVERSALIFKTGVNKVHRHAPTWAWPIGFGMWGDHAVDGTTADNTIIQVGVPSPSAVRNLLLPVRISNRLNFRVEMVFGRSASLSAETPIRFYLYGFISKPVST